MKGSNHYFANLDDVILAYDQNKIELHSSIWIRHLDNDKPLENPLKIIQLEDKTVIEYYKNLQVRKNEDGEIIVQYLKTTTGRVILNYTIQKTLNFL